MLSLEDFWPLFLKTPPRPPRLSWPRRGRFEWPQLADALLVLPDSCRLGQLRTVWAQAAHLRPARAVSLRALAFLSRSVTGPCRVVRVPKALRAWDAALMTVLMFSANSRRRQSVLVQRIEGSPRLVRIFLLLWLRLEIPPSGAACFRVSVALLERVPEAHARSSGSFDPPGLALRLSGRAPSSAPGLSAPCRFGKTCLSHLHPRNSEVFPPA